MSKLGVCRTCGYGPVAKNALVCPNCSKYNPAPGFITKWLGRIITLVIIVFIVAVVLAVASSG